MSDAAYVSAKVSEAVARAEGEPAAAQRLLIAWCSRDDRLLRGLVAPFIQGIVAHAVQKTESAAADPGPRRLSSKALDDVVGQMGRSTGAKTPPRGLTALITPTTHPAAGEGPMKILRQPHTEE